MIYADLSYLIGYEHYEEIFFENLQDTDVGFERTKMDIETRSKAKKDQMTGKVCLNRAVTACTY